MRPSLRSRLLLAARTDALATLCDRVWSTRCLHCRSVLQVTDAGEPLGHASLEHVVPQAWFGRRTAAAITASVGSDADDPRNLALACQRCNQDKGRRHDARGPTDARALEVITALLQRRLARWRRPSAAPDA